MKAISLYLAFFATIVCIVPVTATECQKKTPPYEARVVQNVPGYNSWQMIQALGNRLVCVYSRGSGHTIDEGTRGVYARTSDDGGKTWNKEVEVVNTPRFGEVTIGKGLDKNGNMLCWIRSWGRKGSHHSLYRTTDGVKFEKISTPKLYPLPMQITDVFHVPEAGLTAFWFTGNYSDGSKNDWGIVVSKDNGVTWKQITIEKGVTKDQWPTEPSGVYLGNGRIFCIARSEGGQKFQFQITSTDGGKTWKKVKTNISDVLCSTPSLIYNEKTGKISNYYYQRGAQKLKRRVVDADWIFNRPTEWPEPEVVAIGNEKSPWDAGNVNATPIGDTHYASFYSGPSKNTSVFVVPVPAR